MKNTPNIDAKIIMGRKYHTLDGGFSGFDAMIAQMKKQRDAAQQANQQVKQQ